MTNLFSRSVATLSAFAAVLASVTVAHAEVVIGKLGRAVQSTRIYASPSAHSRSFYRVHPNQYLVLRSSVGSYYSVLLQNGTIGYTPASALSVLPYRVVRKVAERNSETSSRSSSGIAALTVGADQGYQVAREGLTHLGTPYKWGGTDPNRGIDCSGFVQNLFGKIEGVQLPRTAAEQARVGQPITRLEDLRAGDRLYFWEAKRNMIGHTGIYLGNGYFVHSSHGHKGVATDFLTPSWRRLLVSARR